MDYKTGVEKFVDHLMQIYDDSIRSSNPSWHAGRNMFGNRYEYESEDISGIAQIADIWQKYFGDEEHRQGQADVEILNDYVARDIANAFTRAYEGKYTRDQLRQKIVHLLGQ